MQPVVRSLRVLRAIADAADGITMQELHEQLDIPLASLHRLLAVLAQEQYIVRSHSTRRYFIGPTARELSVGGSRLPKTQALAHPALARLAAKTGETAFITELVDGRAICVSLVEGRHPLRLFVRVGQEMPLHAAASARVLLAGLSHERVLKLLSAAPMTAFTPNTPVTVDQLMRHLTEVRQNGYDVCHDELDRNVWAVAAPVRSDTDARAVAAVTVAAPMARAVDPATRRHYIGLVCRAARGMSPS